MSALTRLQKTALMAREVELERELTLERGRRGVLNFTRLTKHDYEVNWHHRAIAQALNKVASGEITRLMINIQPRAGKSELVSRRFPAFYLGKNPDHQVVAASYSATLAARMNRDVQRIIDSSEYRQLFPETSLNSSNVRTVATGSWLRNADEFEVVGRRGVYRSAGVGGATTGYGAHLGIIDDPVKNREEANSPVYRQKVWDWYTSTFYTRLEKGGRIILCMTRWHEDDLAGRLLEQARKDPEAEQWTVLTFPSIHEGEPREYDPRSEGEALWPNKYPLSRLEKIRTTVGPRDWLALYQNRPAAQDGNVIKRAWWRFWTQLPDEIDLLVFSADLNFKEAERSDFTAIQVWARSGAKYYLLGQRHARMSWTAQKLAARQTVEEYPDFNHFFIEEAANGYALVQEFRDVIPGVVPILPKGSKITRLEAISGLIEAGNVYLPDPSMTGYTWVEDLMSEVAMFPNGAHDDMTDALSMALSQMRARHLEFDFTAGAVDKNSVNLGLRRAG